jgi:Flp pilus assembly protein TadD
MSRWRLPPARRWFLLFISLGTAITILVLANRHKASLAAWRFLSGQKQLESEALALAWRYLNEGNAPRALRAVSAIGAGSIHEAEALTLRGSALASLDEVGPARLALERAWKLHPSADAARVLAAIYLSAYEHERGLQMLIEASRLAPTDHRPWFAMGEAVYMRLGRYDLAADAFRQSLKREPDHIDSQTGLVGALVKENHIEEAESILKGLLATRPNDPRVLIPAAEVEVETGREQDALIHIERALAVDSTRCDALLLHARLLIRRGRRQEALSDAEHACSLDPNDTAAFTLLGTIQSSLGLKEQALLTFNQRDVIEERTALMDKLTREILKNPNDPELRYRLGKLADEAGMKQLAIQTYVAALTLAPDFEPARKGLIKLGLPAAKLPPSPRADLAQGLPQDGLHRSSQSRP